VFKHGLQKVSRPSGQQGTSARCNVVWCVSVRLARGHHIRTDHSTAVESATRWQEAWFRRLYGDRLNQFDFRFTKIVGVGRSRVDLNVDLYNGWIREQV
jgi:hypothetical protein